MKGILGGVTLGALAWGLWIWKNHTTQQGTSSSVPSIGGQTVQVELKTNKGVIEIELYADKAPQTVQNFIEYVNSGFYNGTIFHRVIENFMIQGGGFEKDMRQKKTNSPIVNEASNGLKNDRGTIAMARTQDPNSATAQFFINTNKKHNDGLNYAPGNPGYAVFGKVIKGMDVVDSIEKTQTTFSNGMGDVPREAIVIEGAAVVEGAPVIETSP